VRALIVEDEDPAARRLQRLVAAELGADAEIDRAEDLETACRLLARYAFAIILLDLDLAGRDGFEIVRSVRGSAARIIVVSAHSERAIDAFDHAVVDFVTKPVSEPRLARALQRALEPPRASGPQLLVRTAGRTELVAAAAIVRLSGADDYIEISLASGERLLHDARLDELERMLPGDFIRVHRCHIVNTAHLVRVRALASGQRIVETSDGSRLPLSRRRARAVMAALTRGSSSTT
jgi:DNA-binding LytR/AlgR family response regulator